MSVSTVTRKRRVRRPSRRRQLPDDLMSTLKLYRAAAGEKAKSHDDQERNFHLGRQEGVNLAIEIIEGYRKGDNRA